MYVDNSNVASQCGENGTIAFPGLLIGHFSNNANPSYFSGKRL